MKNYLVIALVSIALWNCGGSSNDTPSNEKQENDTLLEKAQSLFGVLPEVAKSEVNPITEEKIKLGKALYFDTRLSKEGTQSCNTCHNLSTYGVDNLPVSPGDAGKNGTRNSPTVLNAAFHGSQFWDGREPDVEAQAGGPILNPIEMGMPTEADVLERLTKVEGYKALFTSAFPEEENPITYGNLKKAIGAFERTLTTPSKFDTYLAGNSDILSGEEKTGLQTFINTGCVACHQGSMLGGSMFSKFGIFGNYWDHTGSAVVDSGKYAVTKKEADLFVFKSMSLRNIEKTHPYFHDGSVSDLGEAIKIMGKTELNKDLTEQEISSMVAFLKTLTGEVPAEAMVAPEIPE